MSIYTTSTVLEKAMAPMISLSKILKINVLDLMFPESALQAALWDWSVDPTAPDADKVHAWQLRELYDELKAEPDSKLGCWKIVLKNWQNGRKACKYMRVTNPEMDRPSLQKKWSRSLGRLRVKKVPRQVSFAAFSVSCCQEESSRKIGPS